MTYLGEERVCLGDHELGKTVQINYKMNFIQDNSQKFSLNFKSTFHWLLRVHCTIIKMVIYFSRISFSLDHSSVSWDRTFLYFFSSTVIYFCQKKPIKVQILRLSSVGSKFAKFLMSFFKVQISSPSNYT